MTRECRSCLKNLPMTDFYPRNADCKACARKAAVERGRKKELRRRRHISRYKVKQGCVMCGYNSHAVALDLHHRDPSTKYKDVSSMLTHKLTDLIEEIRKCDVLCANCHRVEEAK